MSQGLLDFLNIDKHKSNWMEYVMDFLDDHSIDYVIDSDQIKFKLLFLNFEVWPECNFFISKVEKSIRSPKLKEKLNIFLFGFVNDASIIKHESINNLLYFIQNINQIVNTINKII